jgi:hypothetical protein
VWSSFLTAIWLPAHLPCVPCVPCDSLSPTNGADRSARVVGVRGAWDRLGLVCRVGWRGLQLGARNAPPVKAQFLLRCGALGRCGVQQPQPTWHGRRPWTGTYRSVQQCSSSSSKVGRQSNRCVAAARPDQEQINVWCAALAGLSSRQGRAGQSKTR